MRRHYGVVGMSGIILVSVILSGGCGGVRETETPVESTKPGQFGDERVSAIVGRINPIDGLEYVWIEPGETKVGCVPGDLRCYEDEKPRRSVSIPTGFWVGRTKVTRRAFGEFVEATDHVTDVEREGSAMIWQGSRLVTVQGASWRGPGFSQREDEPVVLVSWNDAVAFCEWAGGRLPREVEWEYFARGGNPDAIWPWGNAPIPVIDGQAVANLGDASSYRFLHPRFPEAIPAFDDGFVFTSPVRAFPTNPYSLFDIVGNAYEWVWDPYSPEIRLLDHELTDEDDREVWRVRRGGSYYSVPDSASISRRQFFLAKDSGSTETGFRCVLDHLESSLTPEELEARLRAVQGRFGFRVQPTPTMPAEDKLLRTVDAFYRADIEDDWRRYRRFLWKDLARLDNIREVFDARMRVSRCSVADVEQYRPHGEPDMPRTAALVRMRCLIPDYDGEPLEEEFTDLWYLHRGRWFFAYRH